jgi:hypothetical protein
LVIIARSNGNHYWLFVRVFTRILGCERDDTFIPDSTAKETIATKSVNPGEMPP